MNIFVSHSSDDKDAVERIVLAVRAQKHTVFFDSDSLVPGEEYDDDIRDKIDQCDRFVFCASRHSLTPGAYALTELEIARKRWPHPDERVLTVILDDTPVEKLPPYLAAATALRPKGNIPAEVALVFSRTERYSKSLLIATACLSLLFATIGCWAFFMSGSRDVGEGVTEKQQAVDPLDTMKFDFMSNPYYEGDGFFAFQDGDYIETTHIPHILEW